MTTPEIEELKSLIEQKYGKQMRHQSKQVQRSTPDLKSSTIPKAGSATTKRPWQDSRKRSPRISLHWA